MNLKVVNKCFKGSGYNQHYGNSGIESQTCFLAI